LSSKAVPELCVPYSVGAPAKSLFSDFCLKHQHSISKPAVISQLQLQAFKKKRELLMFWKLLLQLK